MKTVTFIRFFVKNLMIYVAKNISIVYNEAVTKEFKQPFKICFQRAVKRKA